MSNPLACLVTDYGSTISADAIDHLIQQKPVDPAAAAALRTLHDDFGLRIILATNTQPHETRWPALQKAGIEDLFSVVLPSYALGVRKPDQVFYRLVLAAADRRLTRCCSSATTSNAMSPLRSPAACAPPSFARTGYGLARCFRMGRYSFSTSANCPHSWRPCEASHIHNRDGCPDCDKQAPTAAGTIAPRNIQPACLAAGWL